MHRKLTYITIALIIWTSGFAVSLRAAQPVNDNFIFWPETVGCGYPVPILHSLGHFTCNDSNRVATFAYKLGEASKVNTGDAVVGCDAFRDGVCALETTNFLGDGTVRVQGDWGNPGVVGCPISPNGPNRLVLIAVGTDGASVIASISGSAQGMGYVVDFAHPTSDSGDVLPLACDASTSKPQIISVTSNRLDLYLPTPRIYSDCDTTSAGAYAHQRGLLRNSTCPDGLCRTAD